MYVVIFGCGRVGSHVAGELSSQGHSVVIIDKDPASFKHLAPGFSGFTMVRNASEYEVMLEAKVASADLVVAATQDDNLNLMLASIAKDQFGVEQTIARVVDVSSKTVGEALGVTISCSTELVGQSIMRHIVEELDK